MNPKQHKLITKTAIFLAGAAIASIATLWSWNTVAELVGAPDAQMKHLVAATILIIIVRWLVSTKPPAYQHDRDGQPANAIDQ